VGPEAAPLVPVRISEVGEWGADAHEVLRGRDCGGARKSPHPRHLESHVLHIDLPLVPAGCLRGIKPIAPSNPTRASVGHLGLRRYLT
jgi:hypothetical protein